MKKYLLLICSFLIVGFINAQVLPIQITITIVPPYPVSLSYYGDHPEQVLITVTNTTISEQSFRLVGNIIGIDNNVKILTKDRGASEIITLNPAESRVLSSFEVQNLFDPSKFSYTGINYNKAQIDDGLPEGTYEVCGYAVDATQTNVRISENTCSNPIYVTNLEPPIIINPLPNAQIQEMPIQNLIFNWTLPASAPPTTEYTFKMVEIMGNINPNNAIQAATTPIFFEKSTQFNTILYGPADPPLTIGKKYAYIVTAKDPMGKAVFRNGGQSVVQTFTYGVPEQTFTNVASSVQLITPANKAKILPTTQNGKSGYDFVWTGPEKTRYNQKYVLKIVKLEENQSPQEGLSKNKVFYTRTLAAKPSKHQFRPDDLYGFPAGKYAWQVTLITASVSSSNQGAKPVESNIYTFEGSSKQIKIAGNIKYRMGSSIGEATYGFDNKEVKLILSYAVKVSDLVANGITPESNQITDGMGDLSSFIAASGSDVTLFPNAGKVLAKVTTNQMGAFEAIVYENLNETADLATNSGTPIKMYKIIKVVPADPDNRYTVANEFFIAKNNPKPDDPENIDVAKINFVVRALTFQLNVKLNNMPKKDYLGKGLTPENQVDTKTDVYVLRKKKIVNDNFPLHEGVLMDDTVSNNLTINVNGQSYFIIKKKSITLGQTVSFQNLVRNKTGLADDQFYIYAKLKNNKGEIMDPQEFKSYFKWKSFYFYDIETGKGNTDGNAVSQKFDTKTYDEHDYSNNDNTNELTLKPNKLTNTVIAGVLKTHWACNVKDNQKTDRPLSNVSVTLRSHFVFQPDGKNYTVEVKNYNNGILKNYGTTKTDVNGNFNFNVNIGFTGTDYETNKSAAVYSDANLEDGLGWVQKNYKFTGPTGYGNLSNATGTLYKVLKFEVDNPYVTSPDDAIMVNPGYSYNIGTLLANVREGDLNVTVKTFDDKTPDNYNVPVKGTKVYLCRNATTKNSDLPSDEGKINTVVKKNILQNGISYKVIAEDKTDANGKVYFSRLVKSNGWGDLYSIIVQDDETGDQNYTGTRLYSVPKSCSNMSIGGLDANTSIFNSEEPCYAGNDCYNLTMKADPLPPKIAGAVYPNSNTSFSPISGAKVELYTISEVGYTFIQNYILNKYTNKNEVADAFAGSGKFLMNFFGYIKFEQSQEVTDNGKFLFENLPTDPDGKQLRRLIWVSKSGFLDQVELVNVGKPLTMGKKANLGSILLRLPVNVNAQIVEEDNEKQGVKVKAIVGENFSWEKSEIGYCNIEYINGQSKTNCTQKIQLKCPSGKVSVTFYPDDADHYLPLTVTIDVPKSNEYYTLPYKIKIASKKHRITMLIKEKGTKIFPKIVKVQLVNTAAANFKSNASLKLPLGGVYGKVGGPYSVSPIMEFQSAVNDFTFLVSAEGYVSKHVLIHNEPTDIHEDHIIELEPSGTVKGIVKGPNEVALANAKVYFEVSGLTVETFTNSKGEYELQGVPLNKNITLKATATNFIGDEKVFDSTPKLVGTSGQKMYVGGKWVTINAGSAVDGSNYSNVFKVNMNLTKVDDMNLSIIAGFKVEITKATKSGTGYKVSGRFSEFAENNVFAYEAGNSVNFHDIEVISVNEKYGSNKNNTPNSKPAASLRNSVFIDAKKIPVKLYKVVNGIVAAESFSGINWVEEGLNKGAIKGMISGDLSAFPTGIEKSKSNRFGLVPKTATASEVIHNSFTADKSFANTGFKVKDFSKNEIFKFKLHQYYEADADKASSFENGILYLNTTIHTKLEHFSDDGDINLNVGQLVVNTTSGVQSIKGTKELKFNLGKAADKTDVIDKSNWSIVSTNWNFGKEGLILKTGTLNTGIGVTFKNMLVTDTKLLYADYNTTEGLTLGNDIVLKLEDSASLAFGYDAGFGDGAWALSILPGASKVNCASFSGLPGISDAFQISNVKTYSTGDIQIGLNTFAPVKVYNKTAVFRPATINVSDGYVNILGDLDYEIPNMPMKDGYALSFVRENNQLVMKPLKRSFKMEINGVKVDFPESAQQSLDNSGLKLFGTLEDKVPDMYKFNVMLTKKSTGEIELNTYGTNTFYTDKKSTDKGLKNVIGNMKVQSDKRWNNFAFNGQMFGFEGINPDCTMYMIVKGELEADPKTKIGVSNMPSSMGNMSIVYDFNKSALIGTLNTMQNVSSCEITMDLELFFGKTNWYLFGSGDAKLPSGFPLKNLKIAFLVGKFKPLELSSTITNTFSEFTWNKKLPIALAPSGEGNSDPSKGELTKNVYKAEYVGILFAGGFAVPIPEVPELNLNLRGIAKASLTHEVHANLVMGLNFNDKSIAIDANIGAKLNLGIGASVGLICGSLNLNLSADLFAAGILKVDPIMFNISGGASVTLSGTMMVGAGLCDSDCDGYLCVTKSYSESKTLVVEILYQSNKGVVFNFK